MRGGMAEASSALLLAYLFPPIENEHLMIAVTEPVASLLGVAQAGRAVRRARAARSVAHRAPLSATWPRLTCDSPATSAISACAAPLVPLHLADSPLPGSRVPPRASVGDQSGRGPTAGLGHGGRPRMVLVGSAARRRSTHRRQHHARVCV